MDADTTDLTANGFANCITRDGQGSATANQPMNGFRHTGVGNAQARNDYAALGQVQDGIALNWTVAAGSADALTATYTPALTALADGQLCFVRAANANATTTPTFAPNALTAHTVTKLGGAPLVANDIPGNLAEIILRYNLANTRWELLNPGVPTLPAGSVGTTTIANSAVTYAKIQNVTNNRLLGNNSGGAAPPGEIIIGNRLALISNTLNTSGTPPTFQKFISGSGATYMTPVGATWIRVRACGGGGGGGGTASSSSSGGTTSFNSITAGGGGGGGTGAGGAGGAAGSGGSGSTTIRVNGSTGGYGASGNGYGGAGGQGVFGGASGSTAATTGLSANGPGCGGGGASNVAGPSGAGGGGAGEYIEFVIGAPAASYTYTVGAGGGPATNGGNGAAGAIIVEEYYN